MANMDLRRSILGYQTTILSIVGFWAFYVVIITLRSALIGFPDQLELGQRRLIVASVGIAVTFVYSIWLAQFEHKSLGTKLAAAATAAVPAALVIAWFNHFMFNVFEPMSVFADPEIERRVIELRRQIGATSWLDILELAIMLYYFILAWASMHLALIYAHEVREAERTASRYAQTAQDAELRSLRYQVNPHFLFNTLNSLSSLVIKGDKDKAEEMIQNLSAFYRTSLSSDPLEEVTLEEEVELQKQYLGIEAVRYPKRLRTCIDIPAALANARVPALILQPLVENAIKYGVSRSTRPVTITIMAAASEGRITISVDDDGADTPATEHGNGIGLANVRDRLEARYGDAARLTCGRKPEGGFRASIQLPFAPLDRA